MYWIRHQKDGTRERKQRNMDSFKMKDRCPKHSTDSGSPINVDFLIILFLSSLLANW